MSTVPEIETQLPSRWGTAAAAAIAVALVFAGGWLAGQVFELEPYEYLAGVVFALGAGGLALLLFGPSWLIISIFLLKMFTGHQFRSMAVVELIGIEWHPREAFLLLLLVHFAVKLVFGQLKLKPDLIHYFFYLYAFFFALIAAAGVWYQPNVTEILKEIRFPAFLLCYLVFVTTGLNRQTLRYYVGLMGAATVLIALGSTIFFFYTFLTGNVINVQNIYGEYVQRQIGPLLLQSIRPNGHMFFEVGVVLLVSMLLCPAVHMTRKLLYLPLLALLLFAILITMMRTAYVALFFSLAMLVFLSLPRNLQVIGVFGVIAAMAAVALAFGLQLYEWLLQNLPEVGVSLRGRFVEIAGAWDAFLKHPLMGSGMGSSFEGMGFVAGETKVVYTRASYQTVHNVWMYFLFKG
ncbi:MAG: O-antigen ligase family protein, partial [Candidatus Hydrogenedentes bacterium]|nr:O-antigen ligase family protein [Candidatus Hydrogenedentota bacterium]